MSHPLLDPKFIDVIILKANDGADVEPLDIKLGSRDVVRVIKALIWAQKCLEKTK